ncbi:MFS transporter, partial [Enterobacter hormaechei]|uniref:MFS transporter n=1 Tax=Enterobacter hormaechei TaxID=158836 RepID=UPI001F0B1E7A
TGALIFTLACAATMFTTSMTQFLIARAIQGTSIAGGMALQWLLGPLSDRIGRRPVLITGALIFTLACAATMFTTSMTQFLIARAIQGTSI